MRRYKKEYINTYDKNGRIIQTISVRSGSKGIYLYSDVGYSIKVMYTPSDPSSENDLYIYDKAGYLIERDHYVKPGLLIDVTRYKYDSAHNLTEIEQRSRKGQIELRETFKYILFDSKHNWLKIETHSEGFYSDPVDEQIHESSRRIKYY